MKLYYFTILMFKRYLKSPGFAAVLLLTVLGLFGLRFLGFGEDIKINAAIYSESEIDLQTFADYEGGVKFTLFESLEEMEEAVISKKCECGYFFTEKLSESYSGDGLKGAIVCYKSPSTSFDKVVNEIIFSELFKGYAEDIGLSLSAEKGFTDEAAFKEAYSRFLNEDAVISLSYEYIEGSASEEANVSAFSYLRGILGIFIMIGALSGAFRAYKDQRNGILKTLPPYKKALLTYSYFVVPSLLCAAAVGIGLSLSGSFSPKKEIIDAFVFALSAAMYGALIYALLPGSKSLSAVLAFLPLACLIFCPVFTDISAIIRPAAYIQRLLIPTYYIKREALTPLIVCLVLSYPALSARFYLQKQ
ncbi:MAG: hypothetical protein LUG66_10735 [Clostridiales bacterium]|nr:hypothetical protein [Clostridiales bacterium]